jgi:hypothetical protein
MRRIKPNTRKLIAPIAVTLLMGLAGCVGATDMLMKVRNGMAWWLWVADTTEDTTAITTPRRFTTRAAGRRPSQAPGEGRRWEHARAEVDTRLRAASADDRRSE